MPASPPTSPTGWNYYLGYLPPEISSANARNQRRAPEVSTYPEVEAFHADYITDETPDYWDVIFGDDFRGGTATFTYNIDIANNPETRTGGQLTGKRVIHIRGENPTFNGMPTRPVYDATQYDAGYGAPLCSRQ
jgi:hypothetical protein